MSSVNLNTTSSAKGGPSSGDRDEAMVIAGGDMYLGVDGDKEETLEAILLEGNSRGHRKNTGPGGGQARRSKTPDQRLRSMGTVSYTHLTLPTNREV